VADTLVGEDGHAATDSLGVDQPHGLLVAGLAEQPPPAPGYTISRSSSARSCSNSPCRSCVLPWTTMSRRRSTSRRRTPAEQISRTSGHSSSGSSSDHPSTVSRPNERTHDSSSERR
jgi:hypothetical protein